MAQPLSHKKCGFYSVVSGPGAKQIIICGITGEGVTVDRSLEMIASNKYYHIDFEDDGDDAWAYVEDPCLSTPERKVRHFIADMGYRKRPVNNNEGRIAIQDTHKEHKPYWIDTTERHNKKVVKTIVVDPSENLSLTLVEFDVERLISNSITTLPHRIGGRVFWEVRCLQAGLGLSEVDDDNRRTWAKRNFHNARRRWEDRFSNAGGWGAQAHWLTSAESWNWHVKVLLLCVCVCQLHLD